MTCKVIRVYADSTNVGIQKIENEIFNLEQNIPNPLSNQTTIYYTAPNNTKVIFKVTDIFGKEVMLQKLIANGTRNEININTSHFNSGIYFYSIEYLDKRLVKRMAVIK